MSSYELYFQLLPSDLCAASNFRHLYFFVAICEALLSLTGAGLSVALSIAMFTHQKYIQLHTGSHPFLQASTFMLSTIVLFFRSSIIAGLTTAILMNDAEIFIACAQEDIEQMMRKAQMQEELSNEEHSDQWHFEAKENAGVDANGRSNEKRKKHRAKLWPTVPGPYNCGIEEKSLYSAASRIAITYRYSSDAERHRSPTEKARKCFKRRQACLSRQRHILAAFPVVQLLCGAISTAFWFSIDDAGMYKSKELVQSQLPSLRLFNGYLTIWAIGLIHSPLFLLVATWHYARVDWQMQILAVYQVLNKSKQNGCGLNNEDGESGASANGAQKTRRRLHKLPKGNEPCPNCQTREERKALKAMNKIRDSRTLRKAVRKAEKRLAFAEDCDSSLSRQSTRDHRLAAPSALTRGNNNESSSVQSTDLEALSHIDRAPPERLQIFTRNSVRHSQVPYSVPVSPTSLSIVLGVSGINGQDTNSNSSTESEGGSCSADAQTTVRIPFTFLGGTSQAGLKASVTALKETDAHLSSEPGSFVQRVSPANSRSTSVIGVPYKSAFKATNVPAAGDKTQHRQVKRVSFPAYIPSKSSASYVPPVKVTPSTTPSEDILPRTQTQVQHQATSQDNAQSSEHSLSTSIALTQATAFKASSPMTAISEESSGASITSTISSLVQAPTRAVLMPAPRSAPAEQLTARRPL